jgi:hypothetical protein
MRAWRAWGRPRPQPRPRAPWEAAQWPRLLRAGRASATALCLWVFAATLTLHDLHVLRVSPLYPGAAVAVGVFGLAPPFFARRMGDRIARDEAAARAPVAVESALVWRRALLGVTLLLFVAWLILFTSGRTPRW